jgi:DNA-binding transcriptional ArsR family regulator
MSRPPANDDTFRAIADPTRRRILELLATGECPVSDLFESFNISLPAISQHLKILRESALVKERRSGRQRLYRVSAEPLREIHRWAEHFEHFWVGKLDVLGEFLRKQDKQAKKRQE